MCLYLALLVMMYLAYRPTLLAAIAKGAFRTALDRQLAPDVLLASLNRSLFDFDRGKLTLANAGHPPLLHYRPGTSEIAELRPRGLALGMTRQASFGLVEVAFEAGDVFLFCTDGLLEAFSGTREEFGLERTKALFAQTDGCAPEALSQQLWRTLDAFTGVVSPPTTSRRLSSRSTDRRKSCYFGVLTGV